MSDKSAEISDISADLERKTLVGVDFRRLGLWIDEESVESEEDEP